MVFNNISGEYNFCAVFKNLMCSPDGSLNNYF